MKLMTFAVVGRAVTVSVSAGCRTGTSTGVPTGSTKGPTGADLQGTWDQTGAGYERDRPITWEEQTLVIDKAERKGFAGFEEYTSAGEGPRKEVVNGVVGVNGEIVMVDEDGFFEGRPVDGRILGQYVESGEDHGAINVELSRK